MCWGWSTLYQLRVPRYLTLRYVDQTSAERRRQQPHPQEQPSGCQAQQGHQAFRSLHQIPGFGVGEGIETGADPMLTVIPVMKPLPELVDGGHL